MQSAFVLRMLESPLFNKLLSGVRECSRMVRRASRLVTEGHGNGPIQVRGVGCGVGLAWGGTAGAGGRGKREGSGRPWACKFVQQGCYWWVTYPAASNPAARL